MGQILFGRPQDHDIWRFPYDPDEQARIDADEAKDPGDYIDPTVYWLNNVEKPTEVEACVYAECSENPQSKVQLISISGEPSTLRTASDPTKEIPALAILASGATRFVGYACWAVPADSLVSIGLSTPDTILDWGTKQVRPEANSGYGRSQSIIRQLRERHLPLLNAWTLQTLDEPYLASVDDRQLSDPAMSEEMRTPRKKWGRNCHRSADTVTFDAKQASASNSLQMTPLKLTDQSPTTFVLPTGERLNSGGKYPNQILEWNLPNDPLEFAAAASGKNRIIYIAESHILIP